MPITMTRRKGGGRGTGGEGRGAGNQSCTAFSYLQERGFVGCQSAQGRPYVSRMERFPRVLCEDRTCRNAETSDRGGPHRTALLVARDHFRGRG